MAHWISCIVFPMIILTFLFQALYEIYCKLTGKNNENRDEDESYRKIDNDDAGNNIEEKTLDDKKNE